MDGDGCADLIVGDPGHAAGGAVDVLFGSSDGLSTARWLQIPAGSSADEFGLPSPSTTTPTTAGTASA